MRWTAMSLVFALAGTALAQSAVETISDEPYFGRRLEPKGHRVLHGVGQAFPTFQNYYEAMHDDKPAFAMIYIGIGNGSGNRYRRYVEQYAEAGFDTYVYFQLGVSFTRGRDGCFSQEIVDGERDEAIHGLAQALAEHDVPVLLRLGYEFNGSWNNYDAPVFAEAWRHFTRILRQYDTEHVAMAWCYATEGEDKDWMSYYPGDEYVDWWSIDVFSPEHLWASDTHEFTQMALEREYPVLIGESSPRWIGARAGAVSWRTWFARYFDYIRQYPNVKAFSYITYDWREYFPRQVQQLHDWGDARVWLDPTVFYLWQDELRDPMYVHGMDEAATREILNLPPKG